MESTTNISHVIKRELYYQWHSKTIAILFFILLALSISHLVGLHNGVLSAYNRYERTEKSYREQGIDIVEALSKSNEVYIEGNARVVSNPLKDDYVSLAVAIQNLKPNNITGNTLEYLIFVFCTLVFGIYASYVASYDFKYKTYKFISIRNNQKDIVTGKIMSVIIVMAGTLLATLLFTFIGSFIVNLLIERHITTEKYAINIFNYEKGILGQLLLSLAVVIFYIIIGFSVAFIFKSMTIPTVGLLLYGLLIPVLGAYDFRNIFSFFSHKVFSFTARFTMFQPAPINEFTGIAIIVSSMVILLAVNYTVAYKRSAY